MSEQPNDKTPKPHPCCDGKHTCHCKFDNKPSDGSSNKSSGEWQCTRCTFIQHINNTCCDMCGMSNMSSNKWHCSRCTLMNTNDYTSCKICSHRR